jgi:hypothetical protein
MLRFSQFLRHPLTLGLIPVTLTAIGWAINHYIFERDQSALRIDTQEITQAVALIQKNQPTINGEPVFCDTAKLSLLLAHNQGGKRPIMVNSVTLHVEPMTLDSSLPILNCEVDPLGGKPYGIGLRDTYVFDVGKTNTKGIFIESSQPNAAKKVDPNNILQVADIGHSVTLKPGEEQVAWNVLVNLNKGGIYKIWFSADYDAGGPKTVQTQKFILTR